MGEWMEGWFVRCCSILLSCVCVSLSRLVWLAVNGEDQICVAYQAKWVCAADEGA